MRQTSTIKRRKAHKSEGNGEATVPLAPSIGALRSRVPGRLRVEIGCLRRAPDRAADIERRLAAIDVVHRVSASPLTGRVLLTFDTDVPHADMMARITHALHPDAAPREALRTAERPFPTPETTRHREPRADRRTASARPPGRIGQRNANDPPRPTNWHAMPHGDVVAQLRCRVAAGLDPEDVRERRRRYGANRIEELPPTSPLVMFTRQFASLPVGLLLGAAGASVLTGGIADAVVTMAVVGANAGLGFVTEQGSERIIRTMTAPQMAQVPVWRDGHEQFIDQEALVPGDILLLRPNVVVAADARLLECRGLNANEALLTGESEPVEKIAERVCSRETPLADRLNMLHKGSFIVSGTGRAVVVATGPRTEMGRISADAATLAPPKTPLERDLDDLGGKLAGLSLLACGAFFVTGALRGRALTSMLKSAIALAVAAVPEGLPATATTTLALGLRELRRKGVIVRRLGAVEGLGSLQVVCFDKTGTLTENRMRLEAFQFGNEPASFGPDSHDFRTARRRIDEISVLCSEITFETVAGRPRAIGSSTEAALAEGALASGCDPSTLRHTWPLVEMSYRDQANRFMRTTHGPGPRGRQLVAIKGDPYQVLGKCQKVLGWRGRPVNLTPPMRRRITGVVDDLAGRGLRVLGFAYAEAGRDGIDEAPLTWAGAAALKDPIAPGVDTMIETLRAAGIRTIMITGDQAATAESIARELRLNGDDEIRVLDTRAIDRMDADLLAALAQKTDVFARVSPTAKLRIVQALQQSGQIVAMSGDGFNDAPALKAADIAIAVGEKSASAARDVADIIMREGDLGALPRGVEQGRTILSNIRKSVHFIISTNLSEIFVLLAESLIAGDQLETPLELLWVNLVTDILPGLGLALEPPERSVMHTPPRGPDEPLLTMRDLKYSALESAVIAGFVLAAHGYGLSRYGPGPHTRTVTFMSLVAAQLTHALACRHDRFKPLGGRTLFGNRNLNRALIASAALQGLAIVSPTAHRLLGIARPRPIDLAIAATTALSAFAVNEVILASRSAPRPPNVDPYQPLGRHPWQN